MRSILVFKEQITLARRKSLQGQFRMQLSISWTFKSTHRKSDYSFISTNYIRQPNITRTTHYIYLITHMQRQTAKRIYDDLNGFQQDPGPSKKKKIAATQCFINKQSVLHKKNQIVQNHKGTEFPYSSNNQGIKLKKVDEAYFQKPCFVNCQSQVSQSLDCQKIQQKSESQLQQNIRLQSRLQKIQQKDENKLCNGKGFFINENYSNNNTGRINISIATKNEFSDQQSNKKTQTKIESKVDKKRNRHLISIREVGEPTSYNDKNKIVTKNVDFVPVDHYFSKKDEARVLFYQKSFYSITLSQSNLAKDDNKFFIIQVLLLGENPEKDNYYLFTRWGRVGVVGQKSQNGPISRKEAIRQYHSKSQSKVKKGNYKIVDVTYDQENRAQQQQIEGYLHKQSSSLPQSVQDLVKLIFDIKMMHSQMKDIGYDEKRSPLGLLAKASIEKGYIALDKIMKVIKNQTVTNSDSERRKLLNQASSEFYSAIPHDFGYMNMQAFVLNTEEKVKQKLDMLSSLIQIQIYSTLMKEKLGGLQMSQIDIKYLKLKCKISPLDFQQPMYAKIVKYIKNTHGKTHDRFQIQLLNIFSLRRQEEEGKYRQDLHNKMLLWHGSRLTNYVGILSKGLKIAPYQAPATGYMFGKGIYFTDIVSKSAKYCHPKNNQIGLMLLCEVALGEMNNKYIADYNAHILPQGKHSTRGVGRYIPSSGEQNDNVWIPNGPLHQSFVETTSLLYNEYVVYNRQQIKCKYIVQVKFYSRVLD